MFLKSLVQTTIKLFNIVKEHKFIMKTDKLRLKRNWKLRLNVTCDSVNVRAEPFSHEKLWLARHVIFTELAL